MRNFKKIKFPECRYIVEDFKIIDTKKEVNNGCGVYIREILDSGCYEYNKSKLTNKEKLDIIEQLGLDNLIALLDECFTLNNKGYNAKNEAHLTLKTIMKNYSS